MTKMSIGVNIPGGTNVEGLVCAYGSLLKARNITCNFPSDSIQLDHPLEEARVQILGEFQTVNSQLESITNDFDKVSVDNMVSDGRRLTIVLKCENPNGGYVDKDSPHKY